MEALQVNENVSSKKINERKYKTAPYRDTAVKCKAIRKALGLTQSQLAEQAGYAQTGISSIELGVAEPGFRLISFFLTKKKVNSGYLFFNESTMFVSENVFDNVKKLEDALDLIDRAAKTIKTVRFTR